jgi:hypothetical protein
MEALSLKKAGEVIMVVVKTLCDQLQIDEEVDLESCPGKYLKSDALVSAIPSIEEALGIKIPLDCYIFHDNNRNKEKLTIKAAAAKLLTIVQND